MKNWKGYDYTCQWQEDSAVCRPLLKIELSNGDKVFPCSALVDSGTDTTLVDSEVASALDINLKLCKPVKVGGVGETKGYRCDVVFTFRDMGISMEMPVVFADNLPFNVLLGQKYFFAATDVRFEKRNNRFFLKKS